MDEFLENYQLLEATLNQMFGDWKAFIHLRKLSRCYSGQFPAPRCYFSSVRLTSHLHPPATNRDQFQILATDSLVAPFPSSPPLYPYTLTIFVERSDIIFRKDNLGFYGKFFEECLISLSPSPYYLVPKLSQQQRVHLVLVFTQEESKHFPATLYMAKISVKSLSSSSHTTFQINLLSVACGLSHELYFLL